MIPTAETGRGKSRRPNLQNITKGRDKDYRRLLGQGYKYKLRSMFMSAPGHVLIEADYAGAELYGMAVMSGDPNMIDHATRTQLPEEHDRYYDIHSNVAKLAFQLDCEPTKKGLDLCDAVLATVAGEVRQAAKGQIYIGSVLHPYRKDQPLRCKPGQVVKVGDPLAGGKEFLRTIAKTVIFGIAYGRGAKAIAFAEREQNIQISESEAQAVIDAIFTMYPGLIPFFEECEQRAVNERWLQHCFGRLRRFPLSMDESIRGEFQRQAKNFPIQGMIASAVNRALAYLEWYARENPGLFKILLQIHDAVLLEVPFENVEFVAQEIMPWAMRDMVPIYPTTMSGMPTGRGPFYLGFEAECFEHWGEKIDAGRAAEIGLTRPKYARDGVVVKYFQAA
jgi:DNA polymerase I-like protein with 3'-5' exonuclease and polymerase domains